MLMKAQHLPIWCPDRSHLAVACVFDGAIKRGPKLQHLGYCLLQVCYCER